jgi:hypothetical protein
VFQSEETVLLTRAFTWELKQKQKNSVAGAELAQGIIRAEMRS